MGSIGKNVHYFFGTLFLVHFVLYDSLVLLPRQPISFFLGFGLQRLIRIHLPSIYNGYFDGDFTPHMFLATILSLMLSGGLNSKVLWSTRFSKLLTIVVFVLSPLAWAYRLHISLQYGVELVDRMDKQFPGSNWDGARELPFSMFDFISDGLGGREQLVPDLTLTYKTTAPAIAQCAPQLGLPGDMHFHENRNDMEKGVLRLDVYKPTKPPRKADGAPVVVHIHGGGWEKGDRSFLQYFYSGGIPHHLLDRGVMIVSVTYRLSCTGIDPREMVSDIKDAVHYIEKHASAWGGNGQQILLWGTSAGGNLALLTAYKYQLPSIKGVITNYGVAELREDHLLGNVTTYWEMFHSYMFVRATRRLCDPVPEQDREECFRDMSPIVHVSRQSAPTLILHGDEDPLVLIDQALWLEKALQEHDVPHVLVRVHGSHDCDCKVSHPCSQSIVYALDRFLYHLKLI